MYPKNMLNVLILKILEERTDVEHPLSQKQIVDILESQYGMSVDRKTVGRNLRNLIDFYDKGERIHCKKETLRSVTNKDTGEDEDNSVRTDYYMDRLFDNTELQVLIYNVIFMKHIPQSIKGSLVKRLESLSTLDFKTNMNNFALLPSGKKNDYNELFLNLELLNEAIARHKKVAFRRKYIGADKAPFISDKTITLTPFKIASSSNEFYVIGTVDWFKRQKRHELERFRIDSLVNMEILNEAGTELRDVCGMDKNFDFNTFLSQSPTIVPDEPMRAKLIVCCLRNLSAAIDHFGPENIIDIVEDEPNAEHSANGGRYTVRVRCSRSSLFGWVFNPFNSSYVVEPAGVRDYIGAIYQTHADAYGMDADTMANEWISGEDGSNLMTSNLRTYCRGKQS